MPLPITKMGVFQVENVSDLQLLFSTKTFLNSRFFKANIEGKN